jgi:hypothetical protein
VDEETKRVEEVMGEQLVEQRASKFRLTSLLSACIYTSARSRDGSSDHLVDPTFEIKDGPPSFGVAKALAMADGSPTTTTTGMGYSTNF